MRFAYAQLQRLTLALDSVSNVRSSWVNEAKPSWMGFHRLLDVWNEITSTASKLTVWMESRLVNDPMRERIQAGLADVATASNLENQDVAFRKQLWRWTHSPSFKTLSEEQKQAARSSLAGTLTARWPKYKQYQLNRLTAEQGVMEEHFRANLRRDQSSFGVYLVRLGPMRALPLHLRQTACLKAQSNGWAGWWFEANDANYAAFRASFVPSDLKRDMTWARKRVGVSGGETTTHNGTVLARLAELRRLEARLHGESNYGTYAWGGNVFSTPRKMSAFLKTTHKALDAISPPTLSKQTQAECANATCSPQKAQAALWRLWSLRFDLSLTEVAPLPWLKEAPRFAVKKGTTLLGHVVLDLFHRPNKPKTGLAGYMMDLTKRHRLADGSLQRPTSYVSMDAPHKKWTHSDVVTFFHEMGHVLHHLAASSELPATNWSDIEQDATEWPSLFMESWAWEETVLSRLFGPSQVAKFQRLQQINRHKSMVTGLQVAWLDLKMHASRRSTHDHPKAWIEQAKEYIPKLNSLLDNDWARWDHLTIMQGTYAGYLWSEQLAHRITHALSEGDDPEDWASFWSTVWTQGGRDYACSALERWKPGVTLVSPSEFLSNTP
jgi:Zn-dependent oligopeptidase